MWRPFSLTQLTPLGPFLSWACTHTTPGQLTSCPAVVLNNWSCSQTGPISPSRPTPALHSCPIPELTKDLLGSLVYQNIFDPDGPKRGCSLICVDTGARGVTSQAVGTTIVTRRISSRTGVTTSLDRWLGCIQRRGMRLSVVCAFARHLGSAPPMKWVVRSG